MENSEILLGYALQALRETNVLKTIFNHRESKENEIEHDRCR